MASHKNEKAQQEAYELDIQRYVTGVAEARQYYFKVQLQNSNSASRIWIAVRASSIGEAFVLADTRTLDTRFEICDGSMTEITQKEYYVLISRTIKKTSRTGKRGL